MLDCINEIIKKIFRNKTKFLLVFFLVSLFIPLIQGSFTIFEIKPLFGAITLQKKKDFTFKDWYSGDYQINRESYLNQNFGFRNLFIRINNQLAFSLFNKTIANSVIIGKKNYLYELGYINAYYGDDFIGLDKIAEKVKKLKFIQDTLQKLNKSLILVFAPGKDIFYPEYIPDKYIKAKGNTNYYTYIDLAKKTRLNYIDFNEFFVKNKFKSEYPLFPKYGIHWSYYGQCLAGDSIIRYIEKLRKIDMPNIYWDKIDIEPPWFCDYDIGHGMNLLFQLKGSDYAYPQVKIQSDTNKIKPTLLTIADSYYYGMSGYGFLNSFSASQWWYYNKEIIPHPIYDTYNVSYLDLREEINKYDVILILSGETNLYRFGWGFVEDLYCVFKGLDLSAPEINYQKKLNRIRDQIKNNEDWLLSVEKKAIQNKISIDSMITLDAIWLINNGKK